MERPLCGRFALVLALSGLWLSAAAQPPEEVENQPEATTSAEDATAAEAAAVEIPSEAHLARLEAQIVFMDLIRDQHYAEALPFAESLVELSAEEFGSPSEEHATAIANLAVVQRNLDQFDESNEAFLDAIEMYREVDGPFTASTINPLISMGANYHETGDYVQALGIFQEARTVNRRAFGLLNTEQIDIVYHIAATLASMRRFDEAHLHQEDALRLVERVHGEDSLEVLPYIYRYAEWLVSGYQFEGARREYLRAIEIIREHDGLESPLLVTPLREMGNSFRVQKLGEGRGISALRRALEVAEAQAEPDGLETARVLRDIGDWYTAFSRVQLSNDEYVRAWELLGTVENGEELRTEWFDDGDGDYVFREYPNTRGLANSDDPGAVEGYVRIVFDIDENGRPLNVNVLESEPAGYKDETMVRAVSRSRFRPRVVDGEITSATGLIRNFRFHYEPEE